MGPRTKHVAGLFLRFCAPKKSPDAHTVPGHYPPLALTYPSGGCRYLDRHKRAIAANRTNFKLWDYFDLTEQLRLKGGDVQTFMWQVRHAQ